MQKSWFTFILFVNGGVNMTVKQIAEELKVSPQAVYQRLKKSGVDVRKLVDSQTKELTTDGEYSIRKLFTDASEPKQTKQSIIEEYVKQLDALKLENASLTEKLKAAEEKASQLQVDKDNLTKALLQAQDLHQRALERMLPAAGQTVQAPEKLTWKERLTGRRNMASGGG